MKTPKKGKASPKDAPRGSKMAPPFAAKKKGGGKSAAMKRFAAGKMEC